MNSTASECRAVPGGVRGDPLGQCAAVERVAFGLGDCKQACGDIGVSDAFAGKRHSAAWHEMFGETELILQDVRSACPQLLAKGSLPNRSDSATQPPTAPDTVTESQLRSGIASCPAKRTGVQPAGGPARDVEAVQFRPVPDDREGVCQRWSKTRPRGGAKPGQWWGVKRQRNARKLVMP
jgi:hypothetical protein